MRKILAAIIFFLTGIAYANAQVVWTYPLFPVASGPVTIYYDATQGNGALANYSGDVYIHTGVITNLSTSPTDWKHVQTVWGSTDPAFKMTSLGNNIYSFYIPEITSYYGVPASETVLQLAMVFRNDDGLIVGRDADGSDIYYDVWDGLTLEAILLAPSASPTFVNLNDPVNAIFVTSSNATITIYENNNYLTQYTNTDSVNYTFNASSGKTWIKFVADDGTTTVADSFYFVVRPPVAIADLPVGINDGVNYVDDTTVTLVLVAPDKQFVYVIGEFNNWEADDPGYMNLTTDSTRWWVTLHGLTPQVEYAYQYLVDGDLRIADPYTAKVLDPYNDPYIPATTYPNLKPYPVGKTTGNVSVLQTAQVPFSWQATNYTKPDKENLVVYELLIRDFIATRNYQTLKDTLSYLKKLGVSAIELMPINEFEGNESWGYNPSFYFAPDKYYGPADALKAFIDACHEDTIAVIMDIALNHSFSQSPMCQLYWDPVNFWPTADNPWYNTDCNPSQSGYQGKHPFGVGYDFNHESSYTKKFTKDVVKYWITEFKMDGFRFDLSKGFTQFYSGDNVGLWGQYDQSRIDIWEEYADYIWSVDPSGIIILEHFADNSEETVLSNYGMMLWGNMNDPYTKSAQGVSTGSDLSWISYKSRGWNDPHVVGYMESHDEERVMYDVEHFGGHNATYDVRPLDSALNRIKLNATFFFTIPGPKMIWQFGELGYDYSILYGGSNLANKPIRWDFLDYNPRAWLNKFFTALIELKKTNPLLQTEDYSLSVNSLKKRVTLNSPTLNATILGDFELIPGTLIPSFQHTGWWYDYFTGDSINVTSTTASLSFMPGEYRFYTDQKLAKPDLGNVGYEELEASGNMIIDQNFPNPFNQQTSIDFYIPKSGNVKLEVFDLFGKLQKVITDKTFASGYYTVDIPASDFTPGIYIVKLFSEGKVKTMKMEVVK